MIIRSRDNFSGSTTCPYCHNHEKLQLNDMLLYFENDLLFKKSKYTDSHGNLIQDLESAFIVHNRPNGSFKKHWEAELNKGTSGQSGAANTIEGGKGILLDPSVFLKNGTKKRNSYTIGQFTLTYDEDRPLETVISLSTIGSAKPLALCCPYCECFFPLNFFDYDCYFIILAGESSVGKTMWLTSLFSNDFKPLLGTVDKEREWSLSVIFPQVFDGPSRIFYQGLTNYASNGIIPKATPNSIPPIFLTLTWQEGSPSGRKGKKASPPVVYKHNICVIDTMGEMWGTNNDDGSTKNIKFVNIADATIYIVQPFQGLGYVENDQNKSLYVDMNLFDNNDDVVIAPSSDNNDNSAYDSRKKVRKYYDLYLRHFCNKPLMKNKPCAFVITQADLYNTEPFKENIKDIMYFDSLFSDCDRSGRTNKISERTVLLDEGKLALHNIAAYHIVRKNFPQLKGAAHSMEISNFFAISAFSGDRKEKGMYEESTGKLYSKSELSQKEWDDYALNKRFEEVDYIPLSFRNQALNIHEPMLWTLLCLVRDKLIPAPAQVAGKRQTNVSVSHFMNARQLESPQSAFSSEQPLPYEDYQPVGVDESFDPDPVLQFDSGSTLPVDLHATSHSAPLSEPTTLSFTNQTDDTFDFNNPTVDLEKDEKYADVIFSPKTQFGKDSDDSVPENVRTILQNSAQSTVRKKVATAGTAEKASISLDDLINDDESETTRTIYNSFIDDDKD